VQSGDWLNETEMLFCVGEANATIWVRKMHFNDRMLASGVNVSRAPSAGHGHWACAYAGGDVIYDGKVIDTLVGYYISCDGDWLALRGNDGVHIYKAGVFQRTLPFAPETTCETPSAWHEGVIGYGYNSTPQMCDTRLYASPADWEWKSIGVTPVGKHKEGCPRFVTVNGVLWCATSSEDYGVLLRPAGAVATIIVALPFVPSDCRLNWDGTQFLVTAWNSGGNLIVVGVDPNSPRVILAGPPVPPEPPPSAGFVITTTPNPVGPRYTKPTEPDPVYPHIGTMFGGLMNVATFKYYPNDDWAKHAEDGKGLWLRAPGNCCVITGESAAGITAPYDHVIMTPDCILGGMTDRPEYWAKVAGFYLAAEASDAGLARMLLYRRIAQMSCVELGVSCPPFFAYIDKNEVPPESLVDGNTSLPLRFYVDPGQGPERVHELAAYYREHVPQGTPVVVFGMAYDRNGAYTDDLRPIILAAADVAREWEANDPGSVRALIYFSDGRKGGVRDHPEGYRVLRGIFAAITTPTPY
jgi:hypothetical protein